jgi:hypothetical protein
LTLSSAFFVAIACLRSAAIAVWISSSVTCDVAPASPSRSPCTYASTSMDVFWCCRPVPSL